MTSWLAAFALALCAGVAVVPSTPGAAAAVALVGLAVVYRRQDSKDARTAQAVSDRVRLEIAEDSLAALRKEHDELKAEWDRAKLALPRPK